MKNLFFIFLYLLNNILFAQTQIDTSYTIQSAYKKEIKKFPSMEIVQKSPRKEVTQLKEVVYKSVNHRELHLDAYFKNQKSLQPAIVILHPGGWKSGNKSQMETFAQEMASKGYACFNIEYRLSPEAKYPAAIFDVKNAIRYIRANATKFNVDSTKIAVLGCSSGGQMAALVGTTNGNSNFEEKDENTKTSSNVQAIIDIDGILAFKHPESKEGEVAAFWLGGNEEEKPIVWQQASPLSHINNKIPPILFINSQFERFHAGRDDMIDILKKNGIYYEVQNIQNSPHSFWFFNPWFDETIKYTTQFLDKIFK